MEDRGTGARAERRLNKWRKLFTWCYKEEQCTRVNAVSATGYVHLSFASNNLAERTSPHRASQSTCSFRTRNGVDRVHRMVVDFLSAANIRRDRKIVTVSFVESCPAGLWPYGFRVRSRLLYSAGKIPRLGGRNFGNGEISVSPLLAAYAAKLREKNIPEIPKMPRNCDEFTVQRNGPPLCNLLLSVSQCTLPFLGTCLIITVPCISLPL